jgi:GntR family transcriptional regulator/MocR family aminotransferase
MQRHLGLSRNTVVDAIDQLHAEGFLTTARGVGTFVSQHLDRKTGRVPKLRHPTVATSALAKAYVDAAPLTDTLGRVAPFRPGLPALDLFPSSQFKRCFRSQDWTHGVLDEPDSFGFLPLREAIARRLEQTRGVACGAEQVLITSGVQAALSVIATVLLRAGDAVIVEDPSYPNARAVFKARQTRIVPTPVDRSGVNAALFPRDGARLVYVTPSHQYPSGAVLSLERRFGLLQWAQKHGAWILEDDYDSEFNYTGRPQPALHGLAAGRGVLYLGTFSKVLSPALRIAYLVVPRELRRAVEAAHRVDGLIQNTILQAALARFMSEGYFGRHITKMRKIYDERRRFASESLTAAGGGAFHIRDSRAGLHFIAELPAHIGDVSFSARARKRGIIAPPLSRYFLGSTPENGLLIGFASAPLPSARAAISTLASLIQS